MKREVYVEAEDFFKKYLPVAKHELTKNFNEIVRFSNKFPVVLKLISKQLIHKSDVNGVKIVSNSVELEDKYNELIKIAKKRRLKIEGILVQEYVKGKEVIIGVKKDKSFGYVIMFGIGGVYVEVLKDLSFRVCPITEEDAEQMINELKGKEILYGVRGEKPLNLKLLKKTLVDVSKIPIKVKGIEEFDINPFIINEDDGKVVDSRIIFER